jgi:6,7-dimethyl-8-ribityllumazine synthase
MNKQIKAQEIHGDLDASNLKIAIVVSEFNNNITQKLLDGALICLRDNNILESNIIIYYVPGAFEIPVVAKTIASTKKPDAIICLGCIIKHETDHYFHVANQAATGIAECASSTGIPTIFGVLTTLTDQQALERSKSGNNKGYESAESAIKCANVIKQI